MRKYKSFLLNLFLTLTSFLIGLLINNTLNYIILLIVFCLIGFLIPFISLYLTWWLYTLGGLMPIPKAHQWLLDRVKQRGKTMTREYFIGLGVFAGCFGYILYVSLLRNNQQNMLVFFQIVIPVILFGYSLTTATAIKKLGCESVPEA